MSGRLEAKIQADLIKQFEGEGFLVVKLIATNKNGIPDLLLIRDGKAEFVEVKRVGQKPTPRQLLRMSELEAAGCRCRVFDDTGEIQKPAPKVHHNLGF